MDGFAKAVCLQKISDSVVLILEDDLKNVFGLNPCVGALFQILKILKYVYGLKLVPALALGPNPIFEMTAILGVFFVFPAPPSVFDLIRSSGRNHCAVRLRIFFPGRAFSFWL